MRQLLAPVFASALFGLALGSATAQTPAEPLPAVGVNGRFQMTPTASGFLRLDTRTGAVSLCTITGSTAECRAAADDRAALMSEVERLSRRNAELETGGAARTERPIAGLPSKEGLPNKEDLGKAMDFAEEFLRRMMRIMRDESKDRT